MAVALWWKSKPFWKEVQKQEAKRKSRKFSEEEGVLLDYVVCGLVYCLKE